MQTLLSTLSSSPEMAGLVGALVGFCAGLWVVRPQVAARLSNRPKYVPGQTPALPSPTFGKNRQVFDPSKLASAYNLMISTVTPRPIALVSSRSKDDVDNVAPFSYFGCLAHDPPMIAIGFCRNGPQKLQKDSLVNILARKEFAVHIISDWYLDAANHACGNFAPDIDEFDTTGLTKVNDLQVVKASRVKEAAVAYECRLVQCIPMTSPSTGKPSTEIVLAEIVRIHVDETVLVNDCDLTKPAVDTAKLRPMGRLGGNIYCALGEMIDIPRPKV